MGIVFHEWWEEIFPTTRTVFLVFYGIVGGACLNVRLRKTYLEVCWIMLLL